MRQGASDKGSGPARLPTALRTSRTHTRLSRLLLLPTPAPPPCPCAVHVRRTHVQSVRIGSAAHGRRLDSVVFVVPLFALFVVCACGCACGCRFGGFVCRSVVASTCLHLLEEMYFIIKSAVRPREVAGSRGLLRLLRSPESLPRPNGPDDVAAVDVAVDVDAAGAAEPDSLRGRFCAAALMPSPLLGSGAPPNLRETCMPPLMDAGSESISAEPAPAPKGREKEDDEEEDEEAKADPNPELNLPAPLSGAANPYWKALFPRWITGPAFPSPSPSSMSMAEPSPPPSPPEPAPAPPLR